MQKSILGLLLIAVLGIGMISCKEKKDEPTPSKTTEQLAIEDLAGTSSIAWTIAGGGSVVRDGRSETNIYQTFEIQFTTNASSKTYATVNNNSLFDNNGNWTFVGDNFDKIRLSGSQPVAGNEISFTRTGNDLILNFSIAVPSGRNLRSNAVAGSYTFTLKRK
ncbi:MULTISPECIES: hypothetical protein [Rhodonellum]|nr:MULTISPECIES: hypothetical protein [Rhodonellum]SDY99501.1 hypothetical protein SAMN05444412_104227 [Rhodonellum ikkaensis]